ncbi:TIGR03759 family integrating conjugative element protein [Pseudomonas carnis]|uniref:TIGR03759 family integrating conjugative element protein n=1 Tax=Pseudomonas TaxID=286 RepID=UPI000F579342|nr:MULTISPECIES: TIGR03759 family integrating conjugative element protein [Pseudomonas]AZC90181.1 putative exported protein [Pseudomonas chlororaphis subsp. piscium]MBY8952554.1 TIGR03759 family integrating conjugative element protein [Pseudomonas carnis]
MASQLLSRTQPALAVAVLAALLIGLASALAGGDATSDTRLSQQRDSREARSDEQQAEDWGLLAEDWARYRQLQQGPLGVYSPNLDPLTALGIEARNDEERRRFAELQVRAESARVTKELAYQRAYDQAWKRLYPTLQMVTLTAAANSSPVRLQGNGRLALFIEDNCIACNLQVKKLQAAGREFDLYMVGSDNDDARLRQWAQRVALDPRSVRERRVTLNHDAGRWASLGVAGDLPALVREVDGQWQRQ